MATEPLSDRDKTHSELLALWNSALEDLQFFKKQQWYVTYLAFLLYAGVAGVPKLIGIDADVSDYFVCILEALPAIVWALAIMTVFLLECSIKAARCRKWGAEDLFSEDFRKVRERCAISHEATGRICARVRSIFDDWFHLGVFVVVLTLGMFIDYLLLCRGLAK